MGRFDHIVFDERSKNLAFEALTLCEELEKFIDQLESSQRTKSLAFTKLEECHLWIGKAIKDNQCFRESEKAGLDWGSKNK